MRQCAICGKKRMLVRRRKKLMSRYNPSPKRKQSPNLQRVLIPMDVKREAFKKFAGKKVLACTRCIKTLSKRK